MTTTISRHDMQTQLLQQQQQHEQLQLLHIQIQQQQQQQLQQQQQRPQLQQQQRGSFLLKAQTLADSVINNYANTTNITTTTTTCPFEYITLTPTTPTTTACLDSATTTIQIDSINNNNTTTNTINNVNIAINNNNMGGIHGTNITIGTTSLAATTTTATATTTRRTMVTLSAATTPTAIQNSLHNTNNNGSTELVATVSGSSPDIEPTQQPSSVPKVQKRRSLLNFKSLDFHIRSLYSGLRNSNAKHSQSQASSLGSGNANGSGIIIATTPGAADTPTTIYGRGGMTGVHNRMPPYLKIEAVDPEESENLLLDYPQSPYSSRRNSSHDDNRSSSQLLHINRYEASRSPSPSPYFLSPYANDSDNIRRSSTSDIASCKRGTSGGSTSASDSRRPSTSDLLRRARERRGSEARMGRSVSHGGLPRGGPGIGGRRKSMAF